jgi:multicomponent K+:H+ antiporter subunit D
MSHFWTGEQRPAPRLRIIETLPIAALVGASVLLVSQAESVLSYTRATADALHERSRYIDAVMNTRPVVRPGNAP